MANVNITELVAQAEQLYDAQWEYWWALRDERVDDWFMMSSLRNIFIITFLYLVGIHYGRKFMKNRPAYELRGPLVVYNFALVGLNAYIAWELIYNHYILEGSNLWCSEVDKRTEGPPMRVAAAVWWYFFSKLIEFLDTVFFVLRKKDSQISFLHLYHHSTMFPIWWCGTRWVPGGHSAFGPPINSIVHVLMYAYYGMCAMGEKQRNMMNAIKKYMTIIQLTQFVGVFFNTMGAIYFVRTGACKFPEWMGWSLWAYCISMMVLFGHFYRKEYIAKANAKKKSKAEAGPAAVTGAAAKGDKAAESLAKKLK